MKAFVIAKALVVNEAGEILVLQRSEDDVRRPGEWDFPGGFVDEGEDFAAAVVRESKEEAGLTITDPQLVYAESEMMPQHGPGTWLLFVARVAGQPPVTLSFEHRAFAWKAPQAVLAEITYDRQIRMLQYALTNNLLGRTS
jgi:8-oxo-dGTP diphosphatase